MSTKPAGLLPLALASLCIGLGGCTATIDQRSFFPSDLPAPQDRLVAPSGYTLEDALIDLPGDRRVHAVRLDRPDSTDTLVYSGGNTSFTASSTARAQALADTYGTDIVLYDYPGRGGTDVPNTMQAATMMGPLLLEALRVRGWIGEGRLVVHGLSFGGSQASAMANGAGADALVIENSAADIAAVGRNFVPWYAKPFVRLKVDPALDAFRYLDYAVGADAPTLLIASRSDNIVTPQNMAEFAQDLVARGADVTIVEVPGGHGDALSMPETRDAIRAFLARKPED